MHAPTVTQSRFRLLLAAPAPQGRLAADLLAEAAGLDPGLAAARLSAGPSTLAEGLTAAAARRLEALLPLFGLRVRAEAEGFPGAEPEEPRFDLSVQVAGPEAARSAGLAALLGVTPEDAREGLALPGGLVLAGLDWAEVGALRARLAGMRGLRVAVSDPERASYDLIAWGRPARPGRAGALLRQARRLGLGPCAMTGALAAGADRALRDHLLGRFPGAGVIAVNRDFQRFDLILTGTRGIGERELAAFLACRGPLLPSSGGGACIDRGLTRADALCFQADYAVIGLETRPVLVTGRLPADP